MTKTPRWLQAAREHWQWRGQARPPFAAVPGPGQRSVWDFPRPPALAPDAREVLVMWGAIPVARTRGAICVLETAHPPTWYLPWSDVDRSLFVPASGSSYCEWKGPASYWTLQSPASGSASASASASAAANRLDRVAWSYPEPLQEAQALAQTVAMYAWPQLHITVDGHVVRQQPGGFYGGWITPELAGPFKGDPGSEGW